MGEWSEGDLPVDDPIVSLQLWWKRRLDLISDVAGGLWRKLSMWERDGGRVKAEVSGRGTRSSPELRSVSSSDRLGPDLLKGSALKSPVISTGVLGVVGMWLSTDATALLAVMGSCGR